MLYVCGIDPGASGALAFFNAEVGALEVFPMPTVEKRVGSRKRREVDPAGVSAIFTKMRHPQAVVVERVSSMPGQGVSSTFAFGRGLGVIEGVLAAHELPVIWVAPTVWKRHFDLLKLDKSASRAKAAAVFPAYEKFFARAKDDGLAEAALMAMWGVMQNDSE